MIESLAFDGTIKMVGGQTVRINDPNAVFSAGYKLRPEFTADDANPSVTGESSLGLKTHCKSTHAPCSLQWIPDVCATF